MNMIAFIKGALKKHRQSINRQHSIDCMAAQEYIHDHFLISYTYSTETVVTIPESLYFDTDFDYLTGKTNFIKVTKRQSMITDHGIVMWLNGIVDDIYYNRIIMVLDDCQYEYLYSTKHVYNDLSMKSTMKCFATVVSKAHRKYVMNNETYLPV